MLEKIREIQIKMHANKQKRVITTHHHFCMCVYINLNINI